MRKILLMIVLFLIASSLFASGSDYYGIVISTTYGQARQRIAGRIEVLESTYTKTNPAIILHGPNRRLTVRDNVNVTTMTALGFFGEGSGLFNISSVAVNSIWAGAIQANSINSSKIQDGSIAAIDLADDYVDVTGDTMTGDLFISNSLIKLSTNYANRNIQINPSVPSITFENDSWTSNFTKIYAVGGLENRIDFQIGSFTNLLLSEYNDGQVIVYSNGSLPPSRGEKLFVEGGIYAGSSITANAGFYGDGSNLTGIGTDEAADYNWTGVHTFQSSITIKNTLDVKDDDIILSSSTYSGGIIFPDGTKQISAAAGLGGFGTTGKIAKFTSANAVGDSIMTESGSNINVAGGATFSGSVTFDDETQFNDKIYYNSQEAIMPILISSGVSLGTPTTFNINFTTGVYTLTYKLKWNTGSGNLQIRFNGDTGNNYTWVGWSVDTNGGNGVYCGTTNGIILDNNVAKVDTNGWIHGETKIYIYNDGSGQVSVTSHLVKWDTNGRIQNNVSSGRWVGGNFPTSVTICAETGGFNGIIILKKDW